MEPVHAEVSSADASVGVAATIYDSGGVAARTLLGTERFVVSSITSRITTGVTAVVALAADSAGRRAAYLGEGVNHVELCPPYAGDPGAIPTVIADGAGQVDVVIQGYIQKA